MKTIKLNHLAIWVASLIVQVLPPLWYDKLFFGIRWSELNQVTEEDFADFSPLNFGWAFASAVVLAYLLAWLYQALQVTSTVKALRLAFIFWFGFLFLEVATQNAFTLRTFELTLIDELLVLIKYEIITLIVMVWKPKTKPLATA